jgi:hypothetical protein
MKNVYQKKEKVMKYSKVLIAVAVLILGVSGCKSVHREIENISCRYSFLDMDREEDQLRIDDAIRSVALEDVTKMGTDSSPTYSFTVKKLASLDKIHPRILYKNPTAKPKNLCQTLNARNPNFTITYESTDISASIEVIVRFDIKPGAQLFFKDEGGVEKDITSQVGPDGKVTLQTKINQGQEYIFARTVLDEVTRYIKINVYSQKVSDIDKSKY